MSRLTTKQVVPFLILAAIALAAIFIPSLPLFDGSKVYNSADIAWIIVATALVFLMTPGLAFFYGGMVHRKNVISTMIKSVVAAGIVTVLWITVGFSLCFGKSIGGFIGDHDRVTRDPLPDHLSARWDDLDSLMDALDALDL